MNRTDIVAKAAARIKSRVEVTVGDCWLWTGPKLPKGYGTTNIKALGGTHYTHRLMYEAANGAIPNGRQIDHLCQEPSCCNPAHLEAVTPAENTKRGRSAQVRRETRNTAPHCRNGHRYEGDNIRFNSQGNRFCAECRRQSHERWSDTRRSKSALHRKFTAEGSNVVTIAGAKR